ncbi:hypothetical protein [Gulosibacter sediminis]|uniref:hypothetical protein n=1 Tax=Gulosibacter sediminis TaxID=1729695 RepID=UPI0024A9E40E|nr:hypothetical protein [Gulosibacter sediminis]
MISWAEPAGGLPEGTSYQVLLTSHTDGTVHPYDVVGTATGVRFDASTGLLGWLSNILAVGKTTFDVTVLVVMKDGSGNVIWKSNQTETPKVMSIEKRRFQVSDYTCGA